jgi:hypothetical protein
MGIAKERIEKINSKQQQKKKRKKMARRLPHFQRQLQLGKFKLPPPLILTPKQQHQEEEVLIDISIPTSSLSEPELPISPPSPPSSPLLTSKKLSSSSSSLELYSAVHHYEAESKGLVIRQLHVYFYLEPTNPLFRVFKRWKYQEFPIDVYLVFTMQNGEEHTFQHGYRSTYPPTEDQTNCLIKKMLIFTHSTEQDYASMYQWCEEHQPPNMVVITKQDVLTRLLCRCRFYSPPINTQVISSKHEFIFDFLNHFSISGSIVPRERIRTVDQLFLQLEELLAIP